MSSQPSTIAAPKQQKVPRTSLDRADWIKAATTALATHGVEGVRVEALAKECGVTKGSFYWHFKDRNDLLATVLEEWKDGRIRDIRKQTQGEPGREREQLHHVMEVYAATRNRKGMAIELAVRDWARRDAHCQNVVAEVDAVRLDCTRRLFLATGLPEVEAASRSILLYAYVFGFSMMNCERFDTNTNEMKALITQRIAG